ncbi:MAG: ATP-binding cassette domain-containing protein [Anaerolineaceae bacterium]|jgi:ABC-2 type transport system ATP-binding protein
MSSIEVREISKKFGSLQAVDKVSFEVEPGEIFGLLGPNGAGKTTSLRIMLDIFKPDSGSVSILNGPMSEEKKNLIGYLPEERGLYQDIQLDRCLIYLATLKGLSEVEAKKRIEEYLVRFNLEDASKKKVKELSKGMQQKAQLITTLVHEPKIVIIDEPFSALDPINTQMVKDLLLEWRARGATIVMCTHQMHQVEELCDRLALINRGKVVLYGSLREIQNRYASQSVEVHSSVPIPADLPGIKAAEQHNSGTLLKLGQGVTSQDVLRALLERNIPIDQFEIALPNLDEIFIQVVQETGAEE